MNLWILLAQQLGGVLATVAKAKGHTEGAATIEAASTHVSAALESISAHLAANPSEGVTPAEFAAKVESAKATALAAGDEAQARIDARENGD